MITKGTKLISENRQARHEYFVLEDMEAGIELQGNEVKSIRQGNVNLKDSWCDIDNGELFLKGMHISPYEKDGLYRTDPRRVRKLLMHKREIMRLFGKVKQDGLTLVPLSLYFKDSKVKVKVGLCKGKSFTINVRLRRRRTHSVRFTELSKRASIKKEADMGA